jgi:hypothetical protein
MRLSSMTLIFALLGTAPTLANDSTAELATGGLTFVRNDAIEMRSEDLFISAKEIRVRYSFFNKTAADVTVLVAFPMPEINVERMDENISVPTEDPVNLLGFNTAANGKPVTTSVEQRVFAKGIEHTALLRGLGVPLAPHLRSTAEALDRLPREKWDELIRVGLAEIEEYDVGKGMEKHLGPRWTLRTTFFWQQTFPANAETMIDHRYQPSLGATVGTSLGDPSSAKEPWYADYRRKYCMDRTFLGTLERARRAAGRDASAPYTEQRIDYILQTGANWSGPIRSFRLVVDKGDADSLVSFCGDGVKKIGPTQFEMRKTDFTPAGNFSVLILKKIKQ